MLTAALNQHLHLSSRKDVRQTKLFFLEAIATLDCRCNAVTDVLKFTDTPSFVGSFISGVGSLVVRLPISFI